MCLCDLKCRSKCWKKKKHISSLFPHRTVMSEVLFSDSYWYNIRIIVHFPLPLPLELSFFIPCAEWAFLCIPYNISASCSLPLPICPVIWKKQNKQTNKKKNTLYPLAASPKHLTVWVHQSWSPLMVCGGCECVEVLELLGVSRSSTLQLQSVIIN